MFFTFHILPYFYKISASLKSCGKIAFEIMENSHFSVFNFFMDLNIAFLYDIHIISLKSHWWNLVNSTWFSLRVLTFLFLCEIDTLSMSLKSRRNLRIKSQRIWVGESVNPWVFCKTSHKIHYEMYVLRHKYNTTFFGKAGKAEEYKSRGVQRSVI